MIKLLKLLTSELRKVDEDVFHDTNTSINVSYPYLTFDLDSESIEYGVEGFYIDIDIFDNSGNYTKIFELEQKVKDHFLKNYVMTDDLYLRFNFLRSNKVKVADEKIKRRNLQLYCKVDWRNINDN